jgi:hypothetical protein
MKVNRLVKELIDTVKPKELRYVDSVETTTAIVVEGQAAKINFLWIDGKMEDPIYQLWVLHRAKAMAHDCHVVFTDIQHDTGWLDLDRVFGGTRFGNLYLLRVSENSRPSVVPSQRGMYIR